MSRWFRTISSIGSESIGGYSGLISPASAAWQQSNTAIFVPFRVLAPMVISSLFAYNGTNASDNVDIGIYDKAGTRLTSLGSTARSGTSVLQVFTLSPYLLVPETYYMALNLNGTTGAFFSYNSNIEFQRATGIVQVTSAFPLPATVTFAANLRSYIPVFGLSGESMT